MENRDGFAVHYLSDKQIRLVNPENERWKSELEALKAEYEYNTDPDNIPTWASPELAMKLLEIRYPPKKFVYFKELIRKIREFIVPL